MLEIGVGPESKRLFSYDGVHLASKSVTGKSFVFIEGCL